MKTLKDVNMHFINNFIARLLIIVIFILIGFIELHSEVYDRIGVNLVDQGAFINIINHTNRYNNASSFDLNGWPESDFELLIMDHRPAKEWSNEIDDPEAYRVDYSGTYKCGFEGEADISLWGSGASIENKIWNEQSNTTYFDLIIPGPPAANHGIVNLTFSNTSRIVDGPTNSGITNLKIMRPGYDINTEQIFTVEYINLCKAANFACYRYYTLQNIWSGEPEFPKKTLWENRKIPLDASQQPMINTNGKRDAWCWEYIIELANILKKDIWICIHISCDSDYVINLATMLKNELDPNINIYVENSNEVWSPTHMTHGAYNQAQAVEYGIDFKENYARRTVELSDLFAQVFGQEAINNKIRVILAGQHSYLGRHDPHLNFINDNIGPPKDYVYALSTALYFGSSNASGTVEEINEGMIESIDAQINDQENNGYRPAHIDKADEWELQGGCTSYEGGPGIPSSGITDNLANQIKAHRTEAMKDVMIKNFADGWFDIGGGLALQFTIASGYNRYGCWGLTDDYTNPDRNYKMQAMRELAGEWTYVIENDVVQRIRNITVLPNPSSNITTITFAINSPTAVSISITNLFGTEVFIICDNEYRDVGQYSIEFDSSELPEGVYFCTIRAGRYTETVKMVVVR